MSMAERSSMESAESYLVNSGTRWADAVVNRAASEICVRHGDGVLADMLPSGNPVNRFGGRLRSGDRDCIEYLDKMLRSTSSTKNVKTLPSRSVWRGTPIRPTFRGCRRCSESSTG